MNEETNGQVDRLLSRVDRLETLVVDLEKLLDPVLRPSNQDRPSPMVAKDEKSKLATIINRMEFNLNNLTAILDRVDL